MVCLMITIRLHFSLKDDEENNQFILDLAVYRSDIIYFSTSFLPFISSNTQYSKYTPFCNGNFKRKTNYTGGYRINLEASVLYTAYTELYNSKTLQTD